MVKQAKNPLAENLHAPVGAYTHAMIAPAAADLLFVSGQVGITPDGQVASGLSAQTEQALANLGAILRANGLGFEDVIKMNTYVVAGQSLTDMRVARARALGELTPCSTLVLVAGLAAPELLIEIEAIAVNPAA